MNFLVIPDPNCVFCRIESFMKKKKESNKMGICFYDQRNNVQNKLRFTLDFICYITGISGILKGLKSILMTQI